MPFMRHVRGQLLKAGVAARDIHYEAFGPDLWLAATQKIRPLPVRPT
ncbi:hypothetical protein GCM10022419_114450 [Nonomuraea rosea]|uniref:Uncharacterized protein n=1 Tax=Nonomuraea rosea TaxID=638574 RepID=A0ABP6ZK59_9ACTN